MHKIVQSSSSHCFPFSRRNRFHIKGNNNELKSSIQIVLLNQISHSFIKFNICNNNNKNSLIYLSPIQNFRITSSENDSGSKTNLYYILKLWKKTTTVYSQDIYETNHSLI